MSASTADGREVILPYVVRQPRGLRGTGTWIVAGRYSRKTAGTVTLERGRGGGWVSAVGGTYLDTFRTKPEAAAVVWAQRPRRIADPEITVTRYGRTVSPRSPGGPGRREIWAAATTDGEWDFEREDSPGTPWLVYHRPSVADRSWTTPVVIAGSLAGCGSSVASGQAAGQLARDKRADRDAPAPPA